MWRNILCICRLCYVKSDVTCTQHMESRRLTHKNASWFLHLTQFSCQSVRSWQSAPLRTVKKDTRRTTPEPFHIIILYASHCSPSLRFNGQSVTNLAITKNKPDTTVEMWPSACWWMGLLPLLIIGTSLRVGRAAGNGSCPGSNDEVTAQLTAIGCSWGACWPLPVL
jgi:hypothetical protein